MTHADPRNDPQPGDRLYNRAAASEAVRTVTLREQNGDVWYYPNNQKSHRRRVSLEAWIAFSKGARILEQGIRKQAWVQLRLF